MARDQVKTSQKATRPRQQTAQRRAAKAAAAKATPTRKAAPAKRTAAARKTTPARKTTAARKTAPARKTTAAQKAAPARKTTPARKTAPAKKTAPAGQAAPTLERARAVAQRREAPTVRWVTLPVPLPAGVRVPTPHLRIPHLDLPSPAAAAKQTAHAVGMVRPRVPRVPSPRRLAYYGALGVMAAVGALEWPVAAAIGAGVWVASRAGQRNGAADRARRDTSAAPTSGTR